MIVVLILVIAFIASLVFISPHLYAYEGGFSKATFRLVNPKDNIAFLQQPDMREAITTIIQKSVPTITTLEEIPTSIPYRRSSSLFVGRTVHIGQLKLFLTEMQFLVESLKTYDEKAYVVYAGSAPGNKLGVLHEMFPNVKFILVDPHDHLIMYGHKNHYDMPHRNDVVYLRASTTNMWKVRNSQTINMWDNSVKTFDKHSGAAKALTEAFDKKVQAHDSHIAKFIQNSPYIYYLIEGFYTTNLSHCLENLKKDRPLYFVSDIRSRRTDRSFPDDMDIVWNSSMQMEWLDVLRPTKAMLKFHPPYFEKEHVAEFKKIMNQSPYIDSFKAIKKVDYVADYLANKFRYYEAEKINLQAFADLSSSEGRLIISNFDKVVDYDAKDYEDKFFYYNKIMRDIGYHDDNSDMWDKEAGIDACGDCSLMCKLFRLYYTKCHKLSHDAAGVEGLKAIKKLMADIRRSFFVNGSAHGYFYEQYKDFDDALLGQTKNMLVQYISENYHDLIRVSHPNITLNQAYQRAQTYAQLGKYQSFVLQDYYPKMPVLAQLQERIDGLDMPNAPILNSNADENPKITKTKTGFRVNDLDLDIDPDKYSLLKQYISDEEIVKNLLWFYKMPVTTTQEPTEKMKNENVYEFCDGLLHSTLLGSPQNVHIRTLYRLTSKFTGVFDDIQPNSLVYVHITNDVMREIVYKYLSKKNITVITDSRD